MWKRIFTLVKVRIIEFYRDRSALGWNILFPLLIISGFSLMFGRSDQPLYKVGVLAAQLPPPPPHAEAYRRLEAVRFVELLAIPSRQEALDKLQHHRLDLVLDPHNGRYWLNSASAKSYIAEKLLFAAAPSASARQQVAGREISYLQWLFPGVLAMNIMFSALYGVGYVVVRYRKNGVLKRLSVTPTRPHEFLTAQILSRMFTLLVTTGVVFAGCSWLYGLETRGSYLDLLVIFTFGGFSLVALGLVIAARTSSEELADGLVNLVAWPMMFLSEVWFTLEGTRPWVKVVSACFPLTYLTDGARRIMIDGASLLELRWHLLILTMMSLFFLAIGSKLFSWQKT